MRKISGTSINTNMASFTINRRARVPLLVVLVVVLLVLLVLRAFMNDKEVSTLTFNSWFSTEKTRARTEAQGQIETDDPFLQII